jgi:nucleotide-binding universal stress UspA family protein
MLMRNPFARPRPANKQAPGKVLIASEGRRLTAPANDLALQMARAGNGHVRVMTVARLWGTSFGLPNPGLRPSRREMAEQEENVSWAISRIEDAGLSADGHIVTTRHPSKSILNEAKRQNCDAIVMGADRRRNWLIGSMMWSQEPYRVRGRTTIPVHLVGPAD